MNEKIVFRLKQNNTLVPVNSLTDEGIILGGEVDVWPTPLVVEFDGLNVGTKASMNRVRQLNGWEAHIFKINMRVEDGALVASGVKSGGLPPGDYWFRFRIGDYVFPGDRSEFRLEEDETKEVNVAIKNDPRKIELLRDVSSFDAEILRVLNHSESRLDGTAVSEWVQSSTRRASRRACLLNLLAKLRSVPTIQDPLIKNVRFIFFGDVDRIYAAVDNDYFRRLEQLSTSPKVFISEGSPASAGHRKLLDRMKAFETSPEQFRLRSFRQKGNNSFQSVIAVAPDGPFNTSYADMDIDLGNPLGSFKGFVIHVGELIDPGKTDHLALFSKLNKDASLKQFLYYRVR